MSRRSGKPDAPLFAKTLHLRGLLQGATVMAAASGGFRRGIGDNYGEQVARCMGFVTLVLGNLGLVLTTGSVTASAIRALTRRNRGRILVIVMTVLALGLLVSVPWLRGLFGFAPLSLAQSSEAGATALGRVLRNDVVGMVC